LETPLELGATWFSDLHPQLLSLLNELDLQKFPQYSKGISLFQTKSFEPPQKFLVPESNSPSYRIAGGTSMLIKALQEKISPSNIRLNSRVVAITESDDELHIETATGEVFHADKVIISLPPQLAATAIQFLPALPNDLKAILPTVQTWMAGSIKFVLEYAEPFWRNKGYSGMLYSHAGIVIEMYDHTSVEENKFGFTGFLNGGAATYPQEVRKEFVLRQLEELLGEEAAKPVAYFDKVWTDEFVSGGSQVILRPHQNNGHPLLQQSYMNGKLYFSGTETAVGFAGYMEGAVVSALQTLKKLM
jgi:monoamine oxidase